MHGAHFMIFLQQLCFDLHDSRFHFLRQIHSSLLRPFSDATSEERQNLVSLERLKVGNLLSITSPGATDLEASVLVP